MISNSRLLLVDDDKELLKVYEKIFLLNKFDVIASSDAREALELFKRQNVGVVVSDIIMPGMNGMVLMQKIREINPNTQLIMLTAEGSVSGAVEAVHAGAFTYMLKPADIDDLILNVQRAFEVYEIKDENSMLKQQMLENAGMKPMIGHSPAVADIRNKIDTIAETDATVLITGESGTGKEIIASQIHFKSSRAKQPFIKVNCAALTESLLESELFGHEKGSFTGADRLHRGKFEMANKGTLLLDEIGELSPNIQAKLLRVLQEREFERVGGSGTIKTDFRLIASTNRNLADDVEKGFFRRDLYYRINVIPIHVPPLRERREDIRILADHFIAQISADMNRYIKPLSDEVAAALAAYAWPGNIRELRNIIERLVVLAKGPDIHADDLPEEFRRTDGPSKNADIDSTRPKSLTDAKKEFERQLIIDALDRNGRNIGRTAEDLQLARKNLYKKIKEFNIALRNYDGEDEDGDEQR